MPPSTHPPADASHVTARLQQALALHSRGQLDQAEAAYRDVLSRMPASFDALHLLGVLHHQKGQSESAIALITRALRLDARQAEAHSNLGLALQKVGRPKEALGSFDRALALKPASAGFHYNRGNALRDLARPKDARTSYDRAVALKPDYAEAYNNRGIVLRELGRHEEALASAERALALQPGLAEAHNTRGTILRELKRSDEALASYDRALALQPAFVTALHNRGNLLRDLLRPEEAMASYDRALALNGDFPEALHSRGNALRDLMRLQDAVADYDRALALRPAHAETLLDRGLVLQMLGLHADAARSFAEVLALSPGHPFIKGRLLYARMSCCDWTDLWPLADSIRRDLQAGKRAAAPFGYQAIANSARDLQRCARIYGAALFPPATQAAARRARDTTGRIRIGYVSGEFREQATALLMTEVFERHDEARFALFAFDNGPDDRSGTRQRIVAAFDEVVDIRAASDRAAADMIAARQIDILVNLNGYFGQGRQGVFAHRPSPIQVNYLGFPGTLGVDYIDYIVADAHVVPVEHAPFYDEKVVRLPDSYQANPSTREVSARVPTRGEAGLPDEGFVFCSFNSVYKITPDVFALWMRLLSRVAESVLWLLQDNQEAVVNLRCEATRLGVSPERLVFAPRAPLADHLARHALADLFLDTSPCNAHTTASDALWTGLPVLTCTGGTFPGRVAGSLLHAIGLPDLITDSLESYEALAAQLAAEPARLAALRERLASHRATHPLFDTARFCRHLESAYATMWERHARGEKPEGFTVAAATSGRASR